MLRIVRLVAFVVVARLVDAVEDYVSFIGLGGKCAMKKISQFKVKFHILYVKRKASLPSQCFSDQFRFESFI